MPKANAPSAPCVEVWLSPHTSSSPGSVMPCSGPDDVHDPLALVVEVECGTPCSPTLSANVSTMRADLGRRRVGRRERLTVGT